MVIDDCCSKTQLMSTREYGFIALMLKKKTNKKAKTKPNQKKTTLKLAPLNMLTCFCSTVLHQSLKIL